MALRNSILWANDGGVWKGNGIIHPYGRDATTWRDPWEVWATDGTDWYGGWPYRALPNCPTPPNLHITGVTSTTISVAWDTPSRSPMRYRVRVTNQYDAETAGLSQTFANLLPGTQYTVEILAVYPDGVSVPAQLVVTTGATAPPIITNWQPLSWEVVRLTSTGTGMTLRSLGGYRVGQTFAWSTLQDMTALRGTEYWQLENAGGATSRFYTVQGTPAQSGVTGSINNTLAAPTAAFGRGGSTGIDWGVPAMAQHANFPYSNINDGTGATRFQTGNYPRGWIQHQIGVESGYRVRRFAFVQGDGAGNTEVVTPVYSVDGGATFKRWTHFGQTWIPATDATIDPGGTSPNGLLSISSQGSWDRDWNWRLADAGAFWTPYIPENATDLTQRWIYVRWGVVHLGGSFGANCGECWIEYQTPSTPPTAEVLAGVAWG
jgi:hypothetical protein